MDSSVILGFCKNPEFGISSVAAPAPVRGGLKSRDRTVDRHGSTEVPVT